MWEIEHYSVGKLSFNTCPLPIITSKTSIILMLHDNYRRGNFYDPIKSYFKQPNFYIEAMKFLEINRGES